MTKRNIMNTTTLQNIQEELDFIKRLQTYDKKTLAHVLADMTLGTDKRDGVIKQLDQTSYVLNQIDVKLDNM